VLTGGELVEIRAAQRTFEGAYIRTALGQFSFALIVLKIFTAEFYSIGALFAVYGAGILFTSLLRRREGQVEHPSIPSIPLTLYREQAVLFRSRRGRPAPQEVQDQWERRIHPDGFEHCSLRLSACAHSKAGALMQSSLPHG
jgi:hypothetical protein